MEKVTNNDPVYIKYPFGGEDDFDLTGLKGYILDGDCDIFNNFELYDPKKHGPKE